MKKCTHNMFSETSLSEVYLKKNGTLKILLLSENYLHSINNSVTEAHKRFFDENLVPTL